MKKYAILTTFTAGVLGIMTSSMAAFPAFAATTVGTPPPTNSNGWVQVSTAAQLEYIDQNQSQYLNSNIELLKNILLPKPASSSRKNWVRFGSSMTPFSGTLHGNGHEIRNVQITDTTHTDVGLIGQLTGTVNAVGVSATVNVTSDPNVFSAGALVGFLNGGTIADSYATGVVTGNGSANGGLVGREQGNITDCYANVAVSGNSSDNGGLVGYQRRGSIADSYATGAVSGRGIASIDGGLVGLQNSNLSGLRYGSIINSYASGAVTGRNAVNGGLVGWQNGRITDSFFDSQTTTQGVGAGSATGLTGEPTVAMQTKSTFSSAPGYTSPWNFHTTWNIDNSHQNRPSKEHNGGFPYLRGTHAAPTRTLSALAR